jgi:hypothetical protein
MNNKPKEEGDEFQEGIKSGVNHDMDRMKGMYNDFMHKHQFGTFPKLEKGMKQDFTVNSSTKNYAGGGEVNSIDQDFLNQLNQGTVPGMEPSAPPPPAIPSLSDTTSALNQTPDTNYDFYKGIGENERKALYDKLTQQQQGPGSMIAQGLGGLGDAISNSFGGQHNTYMKDIQGRQDLHKQQALDAFDTSRTNRLQGMQGNQEMMMNDPKSPLSLGMQKILRGKGINVPSGMNANVLLKVTGPLGEMAMKEATLGVQQQIADQNKTNQVTERQQAGEKMKIDAADKQIGRKEEAAKGLQGRPWYQKGFEAVTPAFMNSDATNEMRKELNQPESVDSSLEAKKAALRSKLGI